MIEEMIRTRRINNAKYTECFSRFVLDYLVHLGSCIATFIPSAYQPDRLSGVLTKRNLEDGFVLRCLQRLSVPNVATQQCPW